ncbi:hypothetical protein OPKNFCMD_2887 [Methylobacterium crusticola]|uniref:Uncharacterized protein n=1 Tax=Methylobacterium crusticola TaxID=1697972 RepID=A0ABQ4QZ52_9HYPH|nr:hypothetical protein [Methylobacterium crusticola]GJD50150.1 hypothetical protein OPKNFCMD_2887 [Methylobacterium crusticola]
MSGAPETSPADATAFTFIESFVMHLSGDRCADRVGEILGLLKFAMGKGALGKGALGEGAASAGGTLSDEVQVVLSRMIQDVWSA